MVGRPRPLWFSLILCCSLLIAALPIFADPLDTVERTMGLLECGEMSAARTALTTTDTPADSNSLLLATQGTLELSAGNLANSETAFRKALVKDPQNLSALWGLSLCLLGRSRAFEATTIIDRAAAVAPADTRIKMLQAYAYMLLGRISDAATAGKAALDGGERTPFLFAVLAQIHRRMGYAQKALEFGALAAKNYSGMDFLASPPRVMLPLSMIITDTPQALTSIIETTPAIKPPAPTAGQRTDMEIELPKMAAPVDQKPFQITAPQAGATVRGVQRVQVVYHGDHEIKFVVLLIDHVMKGMQTELPYHFPWDADAVTAGTHQVTVRAYDYRGVAIEEATISVTTLAGAPQTPPAASARTTELERRMMTATMPSPQPTSLFTHLGWWYRDVGELQDAISAFEKAAAIDPTADGLLDGLAQLYRQNGLHSICASGALFRAPASASGQKRVALTFDDGPTPLYTPTILAELKQYNAHATFFLVGMRAQQFPELTLEILTQGHELANHSYTHPNMTKLKQDEIIAEVLRNRTTVKEITGVTTYLFRPPGGDIDEFVTKQLRALDYNIVYWDVTAGNYSKLPPAEQAAAVINHVRDGSIVLMHNGTVDGTMNILPTVLAELARYGYAFVTVSELMKTSKPE